jgi:hypothetical protein
MSLAALLFQSHAISNLARSAGIPACVFASPLSLEKLTQPGKAELQQRQRNRVGYIQRDSATNLPIIRAEHEQTDPARFPHLAAEHRLAGGVSRPAARWL